MPMGNIQKQKFLAWLAAQVPKRPPCPLCGANNWDVGEVVDTQGMSGIIAPMAQLVCQQCAYIVLFDARKAGVV